MSKLSDVPALVRPSFFDGQRLEAEDFAAIHEYHRELRWLHNRTLHGWGVVSGLTVSGARGDRAITVSAGYALDCNGRDLVLPAATTLQVPAVAHAASGGPATYYLTISYIEDADLTDISTRAGACGTSGAVRRTESALVRWQSPLDLLDPTTRFRRGLDIVLASALIENCELSAVPSLALRRDARPSAQPYVGAGRTVPSQTVWRPFFAAGTTQGVETTVDTTSAGFSAVPGYTAELLGSRTIPGRGFLPPVLVDGFISIESPTAAGFVARITMPRGLSIPPANINPAALFNTALPDVLRTQLRWHIGWMGIEG